MSNVSWLAKFNSARKVATPLVAIESVDPGETSRMIARSTKDAVIWWDCASGPSAVPDKDDSVTKAQKIINQCFKDPYQALNLIESLKSARDGFLPETILCLSLAHKFIDEPAVIQAVLNVRDPWKTNGCTLVLLIAPAAKLPPELTQDILSIERPLPTPQELVPVVESIAKAAAEQLGKPMPSADEIQKAASALVGLGEFAAENACSLAIDDGGLTPEVLWDRKRAMVNQTPGLQLVPPGAETFEKVGGLQVIRQFADKLFSCDRPPRVIVWIDELEKSLAGVGANTGGIGDSSGTSQDQLGVLLRYQEEQKWQGIILVGPPGSGKSMVAKAMGATYKTPTIMLDLGAMKGSLVGQSEQRVRAAMRIIQALAGRDAYFVATCNRLDSVPPELRRRYTDGIWFSDLPSEKERERIWQIHMEANELQEQSKPTMKELVAKNWTGAEIRNCCDLARRFKITPSEASSYIVPVSQSDPEGLLRLRNAANGKFLSVSSPGAYVFEQKQPRIPARKFGASNN